MGSRECSRGGSLGEGGRSRACFLAGSVVMAVAVARLPVALDGAPRPPGQDVPPAVAGRMASRVAGVLRADEGAVAPRDGEQDLPADVRGDRPALLADRPAETGVVRHVRLLSGRAARPFSPRRMVM